MYFRQLAASLLALSSLLAAVPATAATIAERSPFAQGHWWNQNRSGSGFELFNVGSEVMAIWYTFDATGAPVWYTAQGALGATWPLYKHRWANGRYAQFDTVGSLKLSVRNPESADVAFTVGGQSGTWAIQPFNLSGNRNEVDHTGSYYDPANSGWGLTLTQQGDVLGGVLYAYDTAGAPTWFAGFDRGSNGTVGMISARGACPSCAYTPTVTQPAGSLTFEFRSEAEMVIRNQVTASLASGVNVGGPRVVQLGRAASQRSADANLASVTDDGALKAILESGMVALPQGYGAAVDFSAAPPAATFSTTNVQESGVDEADLVKTDGNFIYTFAPAAYAPLRSPAIRVARVGNDGGTLEVVGNVPLSTTASTELNTAGLYVHGNKLVSITGTQALSYSSLGAWYSASSWVRGVTNIEIFETSASGLPASVWRATVDGHIVSSRRIGDRLYVVARHVPYIEGFLYGALSEPYLSANRALVAAAPLASLMPQLRIGGSAPAPLVSASSVYLPPQGVRTAAADMVLVYAIDLPSGRVLQSLAILGGAEAVYASTENLYVATSRYEYRPQSIGPTFPEPPFYTADIHQVRLGADAMTLVASGSVEGTLGTEPDKAQFRMSEHAGKLRVVTSSAVMWGAGTRNRLTVLERSTLSPGVLRTVSILPNAQRPDSLGKPGELLYSTRFVGDRLYAVTFKSIDPLYVVDVSNAADPKITGALEIPGFSDYLHPLPGGLLLGFGKDTRPASTSGDGLFAWYQGLQLTLFDVSGSGTPREIQRAVIGRRGSSSALLRNHHAFSELVRSDGTLQIAIPARIHDGAAPQSGSGDSATYPWVESGLLRFAVEGNSAANARLVTLPSVITHRAATMGALNYGDPAADGGRAVQFRSGTVYVGNGVFWVQDAAGGATRGPY